MTQSYMKKKTIWNAFHKLPANDKNSRFQLFHKLVFASNVHKCISAFPFIVHEEKADAKC